MHTIRIYPKWHMYPPKDTALRYTPPRYIHNFSSQVYAHRDTYIYISPRYQPNLENSHSNTNFVQMYIHAFLHYLFPLSLSLSHTLCHLSILTLWPAHYSNTSTFKSFSKCTHIVPHKQPECIHTLFLIYHQDTSTSHKHVPSQYTCSLSLLIKTGLSVWRKCLRHICVGSTVQSVGWVHPYGVEEREAWVDLDSRFV